MLTTGLFGILCDRGFSYRRFFQTVGHVQRPENQLLAGMPCRVVLLFFAEVQVTWTGVLCCRSGSRQLDIREDI